MCKKPERQFICEDCEKEFYEKIGVKEHYFREHLKQYLYHCTKCNQCFYFNSHRSAHKNACPNKDGKDIYPGKVDVDPAEEAKFKGQTPVVVDIPTIVMNVLQKEDKANVLLTLPGTDPMFPNPVDLMRDEILVEQAKERSEVQMDSQDDDDDQNSNMTTNLTAEHGLL